MKLFFDSIFFLSFQQVIAYPAQSGKSGKGETLNKGGGDKKTKRD